MAEEIKCPHCGSSNTSRTLEGHVKKIGSVVAAQGIAAVADITSNMLLGCSSEHLNKAVGKMVASSIPLDYECADCDCLFTATFLMGAEASIAVKKLPVPDEIIKKEQEQYIQELRSSMSYGKAVIFSLITVALFVYCWQTDFVYEKWQDATWLTKAQYVTAYHYSWLLWAFLCLVSIILTICQWESISDKKSNIKMAEAATLKDFKHSHRELFEKYHEYN